MRRSLARAFLVIIMVIGFAVAGTIQVSAEAPGLIVIINSDTTWTKANSPYTLTGPTVVSTGVTLTINAGVTVNLNGYELFVNGTLQAIGSTSDNIQISGGDITFGISDQTGLDSTFENVIINSTISSSKPLRMNNNKINAGISVGATSTLSNNIILGSITAGSTTTISNNNIKGDISVDDSSIISSNTIEGDTTTGNSVKILNNTINGSRIYFMTFGGHGYTTALTVGSLSEISNNTVSGGVSASSSTISNNIISGGAPFTDWAGRPEDSTSAVTISGDSSITSNTIFSSTGGYGVLVREGYTYISGNIIQNGIRVAGDALIQNNLISNGGIRVGEIFVSAFNDIDYGHGNSIIKNNTLIGAHIYSTMAGGTATIEQNLISSNTIGIHVTSQMTILNNTITNSSIAIKLQTSSPTICYNNIINYTQNSLYLSSVPTAVNATYNWWGTTDTQAINLTIHDFKYDFNLGKVTFIPFLTEPNPSAPAEPTPTLATQISISVDASSTAVGSAVNVNGRLTDVNGSALQDKSITLSYSITGNDWVSIGSDTTNAAGDYTIQWVNTASGTFTLKVEWQGNYQYLAANATTTLSRLLHQQKQKFFFVESNSTVSVLAFDSTDLKLSFTVSGSSGTIGYVKATIPKELLYTEGDWIVLVDGQQVTPTVTSDANNTYLYFTYGHSTRTVEITGTDAIPEFPSWIILPLLLIATVLIILCKQRLSKTPKQQSY